jgi:hypothetical protein
LKQQILAALALAIQMSCGAPLPTVEGPEDLSLLAELRGTLFVPVQSRNMQSFDLYALPSTTPHRVTLKGQVVDYSGPDSTGRIAYVTRQMPVNGTQLRVLSLATAEDVVVREWNENLSSRSRITLSSEYGQAVLVCPHEGYDEAREVDLVDARAVIIDVTSGTTLAMRESLYCPQVRWSSDGYYLLIARGFPVTPGVPRNGARSSGALLYSTATQEFQDTNQEALGELAPAFSEELPKQWEAGIYQPLDGVPHEQQSNMPGYFRGVAGTLIAVIDRKRALYNGLPTEGAEQRLINFSMAGPTAEWTIKVSDLESGRFCTVIPYVRAIGRYCPVEVGKYVEARGHK